MSDVFIHVPATVKRQKGFLRRITAATALGEGLDGYDLGIISVVLPAITVELGLSPVMIGLIGASTLIGIFFGAPAVGFLTDRYGRRKLFTVDIVSFVILGLLQLVIATGWQLLVVRLLLGVAIGAEYAIGSAMLAELSPSHGRGGRLSWLQTCWYLGFLGAVLVAYWLTSANVGWRVILATSAIPAIVTLVLRYGLPESPRWLMSRDRVEEARQIVNKYLGGEHYFRTEDLAGEEHQARPVSRPLGARHAPADRVRVHLLGVFGRSVLRDLHVRATGVLHVAHLQRARRHDRSQQRRRHRCARRHPRDRTDRTPAPAVDVLLGDDDHTRGDRRLGRGAGNDRRLVLRVLLVLQRDLRRSLWRVPERAVPLGAARQRHRRGRRVQPHRRRQRHLPAPDRHHPHRHRRVHADRCGPVRHRPRRDLHVGARDHRHLAHADRQ